MIVKGSFKYVGMESIKGKKDPNETYYSIVLLQDTDVVKVFATKDDLPKLNGLKQMDNIDVELGISVTPTRTYINIKDVKKIA